MTYSAKYPAEILAALERSNRSAREVSIAAVGHESAVRSLKRGLDLRGSTIQALCDALGLEFYVGPPRNGSEPQLEARDSDASDEPSRDELAALRAKTEALREELHAQYADILSRLPPPADDLSDGNVAPIPLPEDYAGNPRLATFEHDFSVFPRRGDVGIAAGAGAFITEKVTGYIAFPTVWSNRHGLFPEHCNAFEVWGESMVPGIEDGAMILVDHRRTTLIHDRIFAVWTEDGSVVKRLMRNDQGAWALASDNPDKSEYPTLGLPREAKILGQVAWTGKILL